MRKAIAAALLVSAIFLGFGSAHADLTYNYVGLSFTTVGDPTLGDHLDMTVTFDSTVMRRLHGSGRGADECYLFQRVFRHGLRNAGGDVHPRKQPALYDVFLYRRQPDRVERGSRRRYVFNRVVSSQMDAVGNASSTNAVYATGTGSLPPSRSLRLSCF